MRWLRDKLGEASCGLILGRLVDDHSSGLGGLLEQIWLRVGECLLLRGHVGPWRRFSAVTLIGKRR